MPVPPKVAAPKAEEYPVYPPPTPKDILADRKSHDQMLRKRRYAVPRGAGKDTPLFALYRFYEVILLDEVFQYRNLLEHFWRQPDWVVCNIPDPKDDDPARYAFLACLTYFLVRSFNRKIKIGASRSAPAIMSNDLIEELRNKPEDQKTYEKVPAWVEKVPALQGTLVIPTHDGEILSDKDDERADKDFLSKNILIWTPHIHFT